MAVRVLNKLEQIKEEEIGEGYVQCIECGLIEDEEWSTNHICNRITNVKHKPQQDLILRIGKRIFVKIKVNAITSQTTGNSKE